MTDSSEHPGEAWRDEIASLCLGCRALADAPRTPSDMFPSGPAPQGMRWVAVECPRCGITDTHLRVIPVTDSREPGRVSADGSHAPHRAVPARSQPEPETLPANTVIEQWDEQWVVLRFTPLGARGIIGRFSTEAEAEAFATRHIAPS